MDFMISGNVAHDSLVLVSIPYKAVKWGYPSCHNHGSVKNGCISNRSYLSNTGTIFHFHDSGRKSTALGTSPHPIPAGTFESMMFVWLAPVWWDMVPRRVKHTACSLVFFFHLRYL